MKSMYFIVKENIPFAKYTKVLELLANLGATSSAGELPRNANLRGEKIKDEIINVLGNVCVLLCQI